MHGRGAALAIVAFALLSLPLLASADGSQADSSGDVIAGPLVVFDTDEGLTYSILSRDADTVAFSVSVDEGYEVIGDIEVAADRGELRPVGEDSYLLDGIDGNTRVTVTGEVNQPVAVTPDAPVTGGQSHHVPDDDFDVLWVAVTAAVILIAVVGYAACRRLA